MEKSADAFRTISEVAEVLETPAHVLRFWESRFPQIRPVKRAGGRRYYRPADIALLSGIKRLLHDEGMTIRGVQKILREQGVRHVAGLTGAEVAEAPFENVEDADVVQPVLAFGKGAAVERRGEVVAFSSATSEPAQPEGSEPPEDGGNPVAFVEPPTEAAPNLPEPVPDVTAEAPPAEADPAPAYAASPPEAEPEPVAIEPLEETVAERPAPEPVASTPPDVLPVDPEAEAQVTGPWLPALLRGLLPGALVVRRDAVTPLHARLLELRERLASAHRGGRR